MKAMEKYGTLLEALDALESGLAANRKRFLTFDERETIAAAWTSLRRMCVQRDQLVEALREASIAFDDHQPEDWLMSWHDRLVAREVQPSLEVIRGEVHERMQQVLRGVAL